MGWLLCCGTLRSTCSTSILCLVSHSSLLRHTICISGAPVLIFVFGFFSFYDVTCVLLRCLFKRPLDLHLRGDGEGTHYLSVRGLTSNPDCPHRIPGDSPPPDSAPTGTLISPIGFLRLGLGWSLCLCGRSSCVPPHYVFTSLITLYAHLLCVVTCHLVP